MALKGTNGSDVFDGTIFADEIFGFAGDDFIGGSPGADTIDGGADTDTVNYAYFYPLVGGPRLSDAVNVDLQRASQFGGDAQGDVLIGIENVSGSAYNDDIRGDNGDNEIRGNGGSDHLEGRGGDDVLRGDASFSFILDPAGNDHLDGGAGDDQLFGDNGADTLLGGLDNDQLFGGGGNDTLFGDAGLDSLDGGAGVDTASYANSAVGVTVVLLANGNGLGFSGDAAGDSLFSVENLTGSAFADSLTGSAADNVLSGGGGNDTLAGGAGEDHLIGGTGFDTATYATSGSSVMVDLNTGDGVGGDANGDELTAIENLIGSAFTDILSGNAAGNLLDGGGGNDLMAGRGGNDVYIVGSAGDIVNEAGGQGIDEVRTSVSYTLTAGSDIETLRTTDDDGVTGISLTGNASGNTVRGNDGANLINGGDGNDTLTGLGGQDVFLFNTALNAATNVDFITDFTVADDAIQLQNGVFTGLTAGTLAANQFVIGAAAQDADDRIVYDDTTGALFFDIDGAGGTAAVRFATVSAGLALTNNDFLVV